MKLVFKIALFSILFVSIFAFINKEKNNDKILFYKVDLSKQNLQFFWKNKNGDNYKNFTFLIKKLQENDKELVFAMNGGMYQKDFSPQGLYIENGKELAKLNTVQEAYGNFYMQPNGIFYIDNNNKALVIETNKFVNKNIKFATQSGPMLLIDGEIHSKFTKGSTSLNIRNGVGVLPNGNILFAMSKEKINFYAFATYFKSLGCQNALYLDGFVSKTYLPSKNWKDNGGNFGVIIAEIK